MSERCGEPTKTTGKPCRFRPAERCPHHGPDPVGNPGAGRPTVYDREVADEVCRRIAQGESLRNICDGDDMPPAPTVVGWANDDRDGFAERYARALDLRNHIWAEEILHISDDRWNDTYVDDEGERRVDYEHIQRSKLRVDTRKWLLSKLMPEKFGKRQRIEHSGPEGGPIEVEDARERLADQLDKIMQRRAEVSGPRANGDG